MIKQCLDCRRKIVCLGTTIRCEQCQHEKNREVSAISAARWRTANPEKARAATKKWQKKNIDRVNAWRRARYEWRRIYDADFRQRQLVASEKYRKKLNAIINSVRDLGLA